MTEVAILPPSRIKAGENLLRSLRDLGVATETSLDLPEKITYNQYEALGIAIMRGYRSMVWLLADWLNQGQHLFKERVWQAVEATGLNRDTLENYARTARQVPPERRVAGVPFSIHTEVGPLEPLQQELWLEKAVANHWKREELRAELRPIKLLIEEDFSTPAWEIDHARVEEAARDLISSSKIYGDGYLIPRYAYNALSASLNEGIVV